MTWKKSLRPADILIRWWYNRGMSNPRPGMSPDMADACRDVLALVRTEMIGDREGTYAITNSLDADQARRLLIMTASLAGCVIKARAIEAGVDPEEFLMYFSRNFLNS